MEAREKNYREQIHILEEVFASRPAPEPGQNIEEILLDLGYSWEEVTQLKEQNVIL